MDRRAFTEAELSHLMLIAEIHGISRQTLIVRLIGVGLMALEAGCDVPAMPDGSFDAVGDAVGSAHGGDNEAARNSGGGAW
jgi:hypothetical protein